MLLAVGVSVGHFEGGVTDVVAHPTASKSLADLLAQSYIFAVACRVVAEIEPALASQVLRILLLVQ